MDLACLRVSVVLSRVSIYEIGCLTSISSDLKASITLCFCSVLFVSGGLTVVPPEAFVGADLQLCASNWMPWLTKWRFPGKCH